MYHRLSSVGAALLATCLAAVPAAAEYPERPITIILPVNPGGSLDIAARTWGPYLERCLGGRQSVIPVNMPGGGNVIAFTHLVQQPADGYTIGVLNQPNLSIALVTKPGELQFDGNSFDYFGNFTGNQHVVAVAADSPLKTFEDFLALARSRPVNTGITGPGTDDAIVADQLVRKAPGAQVVPIPLGGSAPVATGLLGGHIDAGILAISTVKINEGKLRALAVTTAERLPDWPDLPTMRESGVDILSQSAHVIGGRKEIPADIKQKLIACFDQIRADPAFWEEADKRQLPRSLMTAEEATEYVNSETERLRKLWAEAPW